jgi:hypothetical protein
MQQNSPSLVRSFLPLTLIFVVSMGFFLAGRDLLEGWGLDQSVLLAGNMILFIATLISFYFYWKSLENDRVQVFLRMVYSGMFVKMMICLFAALIYIMIAKKGVNKGGIFVCMFLYVLYTFVEMSILMKVSKLKKNG